MPLSEPEIVRYARQLLLPGWGRVPQEFLRSARVQVVGGGPLAGPALAYLGAAGVGLLLLDDGADLAPDDAAGWLYPPQRAGEARAAVAIEALRASSAFSQARLQATGLEPTAALIGAGGSVAREAAERSRRAGIPHVVATGDDDGGSVVVVPPRGPCYACAFRPGTGKPTPPASAAALGALAAAELVLLITAAGPGEGKRIDLARGLPSVRPTVRRPDCECGRWGG